MHGALMQDPVFIEAWLRLVTETMQGGARAQETFRCLAEAWKSQEELNKWMQRFLPVRSETSRPEEVREWIEDWWKVMGVVPRSRYLELLERSEVMRARLEGAEEAIRQ